MEHSGGYFISVWQTQNRIGGRVQSSTSFLRIALDQWTVRNSHGWFFLPTVCWGTHQVHTMHLKVHLQSPWLVRACKSCGRSTRLTLPFMAMSTIMNELALSMRWISKHHTLHHQFLQFIHCIYGKIHDFQTWSRCFILVKACVGSWKLAYQSIVWWATSNGVCESVKFEMFDDLLEKKCYHCSHLWVSMSTHSSIGNAVDLNLMPRKGHSNHLCFYWLGFSMQNQCISNEKDHYSGTYNATIHIVAGGAGAHLSAFTTIETQWSLVQDFDHGFTKLTAFNRSSLLFEYKRSSDGLVYDQFTITREYKDVLGCDNTNLQQFCPPKTLATWFWPASPAIIFGLWFTWFRLPCNKVGFFDSHGQQMIILSRFDLSGWIGSMATYNGRLWILHIVTKLQTSCCTMFGTKHCAVCLVQTNGKLFDTNLVGCCTHLHCWWVGTTLVWEPLSPCHP